MTTIHSVIRYDNAHAIEVTWVDNEGNVARCHIYANTQMSELRADLGADVSKYELLISSVEATQEVPPPAAVPESCTPAQGLVALYVLRGITEDALNSTIEAIQDDTLRYTTRIGFARATEWRRRSPSILLVGELLSLSAVDLDALFTHAVTVEV